MTVKTERNAAVAAAIAKIRDALRNGATTRSLERAEATMLALAAQAALFPRTAFPVPDEGQTERTFLIHEDEDGRYALYVNSGRPGQHACPHDHGGAWAIVVAVEGEETHRLYRDEADTLEQIKEVLVCPGSGVVVAAGEIHSIHANSDQPLLHLHLYELSYANQGRRKAYDPQAGTVRQFVLEDVGFVEDAR